jgi:hypothetical protein
MNGAEEGEEGKPKKKAPPPKKAPAAEKKVAERKAPAKKRAAKKVLFLFLKKFTLTHIFDRMQKKSPARTLLRISTTSQPMMTMNFQRPRIRSERYVLRISDMAPQRILNADW